MLNISANLRLNLTGAEADPGLRAQRYQTAIDMAEYADKHGFTSVNVEEHHDCRTHDSSGRQSQS